MSKEEIYQDLLRRGKKLFPKFLDAQGGKCAQCGRALALEKACKRACNFDIICSDCYAEKGSQSLVVFDEIASVPEFTLPPTGRFFISTPPLPVRNPSGKG
jgi:hypothetical protein